MQVMARLLKNKNVHQMNIIDLKQETDTAKTTSFVKDRDKKQTASIKRGNAAGNNKKILKRNVMTNKINPNHPSDIVFAILSEDARKKALETVLPQSINVERRKKPKEIPFDSVTFLLNSGYRKEHFDRLLSKVF